MEVEDVQGRFRRGLLPLIILSLLKQRNMYVYQLVQEAKLQSGGAIVTQEGICILSSTSFWGAAISPMRKF